VTRLLHLAPEAVRGDQVTFEAAAAHHLGRVLRASVGDVVEAVAGGDALLSVRLTAIAARSAEGVIVGRAPLVTESPLDLTLAQGLPKGDKMDGIVRMATELGVTRVLPLLTARTVVRLEPARSASRLVRWRRIAREAAQQCGRARVPEIAAPRGISPWAREAAAAGLLICLWEEAGEALDRRLPPGPCASVSVVVGPEGGLAAEEVRELEAAGAVVAGLGPRLLRTDTAGAVAVALLQSRYGDLGTA
jgi:16S rRNA (uracil1498-N3)-methyltransferase